MRVILEKTFTWDSVNGTLTGAGKWTARQNLEILNVEAVALTVAAATLASVDVLDDGVSILSATMNLKAAGASVIVAGAIVAAKRNVTKGSIMTVTPLTTVGAMTYVTVTIRYRLGLA